MMSRLIRLQVCLLALLAVLVWLVWGAESSLSVVMGGGSILLPSTLYAWRLGRSSIRALPSVILTGALLKILLSIVLLATSVAVWPGLHWPAFLGGLILISLSVLAGPWAERDPAADAKHIERILGSQRPPQD